VLVRKGVYKCEAQPGTRLSSSGVESDESLWNADHKLDAVFMLNNLDTDMTASWRVFDDIASP